MFWVAVIGVALVAAMIRAQAHRQDAEGQANEVTVRYAEPHGSTWRTGTETAQAQTLTAICRLTDGSGVFVRDNQGRYGTVTGGAAVPHDGTNAPICAPPDTVPSDAFTQYLLLTGTSQTR